MKTSILTAVALSLTAAASTLHAASFTWFGTNSTAWTNAANWFPGIPDAGGDVVIADTTAFPNSISMTDSRTIGSMTFGTTGTRITAFQITNSVAANSLTFTNGLIANGNLGAVINFFRIPTIIGADQTWSIGGAPGAVTADFGIGVTPRANGTQTPFTLNGNVTKTGTGALTFIGANITGNGNLTINQGLVKFNGGSSTTMSASGGGSIVINTGGKLMLFRNSGAVTCTKPITLNAGGTLEFGGNTASGATYGFPLTMNGNVNFSAGGGVTSPGVGTYLMTGPWTGNASVNGTAASAQFVLLVLSNNITGWTGSFNNAGNAFRIAFSAATPGNAAVAWSLNNAGAILEAYGATNVQLGSLGGNSGTLRNSDPAAQAATVTVGALNTSTTFGAVIADNTASLGLVKVGTGALTLTGNNTFSGGTIVSNGAVILQGATAAIGSGSVTVRAGASFGGNGNVSGIVSVDGGGAVQASGGVGAPPLNVSSLTLGNASTDVTTSQVNVYSGGKIVCGSSLTVNGTNTINMAGAVPPVGIYDLITYNGAIGGSGFAGFKLGTLPTGVTANLQDSGTAIQLNITATGESSVWAGNVAAQWNLAGGLEWKGATSGTPQGYLDLYPVFFNDSASNFVVNITENVTPGTVSVSNTTAYTYSGVGGVVGTAGLVKNGTGTLTILNTNTYSGGTFISNGVVQLGNGGTSGIIPGTVFNDGLLAFNRADALTLNGISGNGSLEQRGTGVATVGGANSYTGLATVVSGTLAAGSGTALGVTNSGTVIVSGATLDVNSQNLGGESITVAGTGVGGAGAIVNNGTADSQNATRYVTLTGPTTFGGARRWDIRHPAPANDPNGGGAATLTGNGYDLTKISTNVVAFINIGDTGLGDVDIQGGTLTFSRSTVMGDSSRKITVRPGATLQLHRTSEFIDNQLNKVVFMTNATLAIEGGGLTNNNFAGPVTITDTNTVSLPSATGLNLRGSVSGNGSIVATGPGTLILSGNATHTGGTTLGGSVLQVDGSLGTGAQPLLITSPSTVAGNGVIRASIVVPSGSVMAPGAHGSVSTPGTTIGTLTISNALTLQAGCSNVFEINKDLATNDFVRGITSVTYGGTLVLNNVGSTTYAPGDNFKLFSASSYSGGFASFVPATPALGLIWVTNNLTVNGTIGVMVLPTPIPLYVLSASSLVSTNVNVFFTSPLDPNTSQNPANYTMSTSNQVVSATLLNPTNVLLGLDTPITNTSYALRVQSVQDQAFIPNVVTTTNVPGVAIGFAEAFRLGSVTNGSAFAFGTNSQFRVYSDGTDIFGTVDNGEFIYKYVSGDFDVSVRLESLLQTDPAAKAGIMARDVTDATFPLFDDRFYMVAGFTADPTRNINFVQYREAWTGTAVAPPAPRPPATYPNNWLRLKRSGSVMQGYSGPDGLVWTPMTFVDSATNAAGPYPDTIRIGLAVTSHNAAQTTEAVFSRFGPATELGFLSITNAGTDVVVSWQAGSGATLQVNPAVTSPSTWTNIPGSDSTNLIFYPAGSSATFFRLVK